MLEGLREASQTGDPKQLAPRAAIQPFHAVVRSIAPREDGHRFSLHGVYGITMGRLHRHVEDLRDDCRRAGDGRSSAESGPGAGHAPKSEYERYGDAHPWRNFATSPVVITLSAGTAAVGCGVARAP